MKKINLLLTVLLMAAASLSAQVNALLSPDKRLEVKISNGDQLTYQLFLSGKPITQPSPLALRIGGISLPGAGAKIQRSFSKEIQTEVYPVVRQKSKVLQNHCNELTLVYSPQCSLIFRAYNEGFAYRFVTDFKNYVVVDDELFSLNLSPADTVWFPEEEGFYSHNERQYKKYSAADVTSNRLGSLPALVSCQSGPLILVTESDLQDYPGLWLRGIDGAGLRGDFARYPEEEKPKGDRDILVTKRAPYLAETKGARNYPWRILAVAAKDADLLTNSLPYLLADTCRLSDVSWIRPGKVAWDWWNNNNIYGVDFKSGLNTATYKFYIDFAARFGLEYIVLDEGWSKTDDLLSVNPDIDLPALFAYAKEKKVGIILWVLWNSLDRQLQPALDQFERWGAKGVKVDFMQRDDQKVVNYYWKIAAEAARRHMLVDFHGAHKPTGWNRPFPNVITSEGVYGLEQSKWDVKKAIDPEHNLTLPFIRMVAGPMDYTPGAMHNAQRADWAPLWNTPMSLGTRCHQLAMYVVFESPLQMLADNPSNYLREQGCMQFLSVVPTVWDQTQVLDARVSDYVVIARKAANGDWFIGAMTDWTPRFFDLRLDFPDDGDYQLESWQDGVNADRFASDYKKMNLDVKKGEVIHINLAPGGGWVGRMVKK